MLTLSLILVNLQSGQTCKLRNSLAYHQDTVARNESWVEPTDYPCLTNEGCGHEVMLRGVARVNYHLNQAFWNFDNICSIITGSVMPSECLKLGGKLPFKVVPQGQKYRIFGPCMSFCVTKFS